MSPLYPLSVHRRLERQWANCLAKPIPHRKLWRLLRTLFNETTESAVAEGESISAPA